MQPNKLIVIEISYFETNCIRKIQFSSFLNKKLPKPSRIWPNTLYRAALPHGLLASPLSLSLTQFFISQSISLSLTDVHPNAS